MATSMALGGTGGMSIGGLGTNSPIGGVPISSNGSIGNLTPSHAGLKYCSTGGSGTSSIHSPVSTPSSTPNSTGTINSVNTGSIGKCPGSNGSINGGMANNNSENIIANNNNNSNSTDIFGSKCKRKINFSNLGMPGRAHQPATVAKRNARERNRVKQVNNGFAALKQHIPPGVRSKKMSKVETLRCAVDYIKNLQGLLNIHGSFGAPSPGGSSTSGDFILMDDDDYEDQKPSIAELQQAHHLHQQQQQQQQQQLQHQQQQMNGVSNQRDAFALSSSSSSSSPTSSVFGAAAAHLPHHLASLHSHQHQPHHLANNNSNQLRHNVPLSHHLHHNNHHAANGVSVAAALLAENPSSTVTPNSNQLSPTSSDDPSSPSYASEASSYVNSTGNVNVRPGNGLYDYENYEPVSPEDEELLDAIAFWQQS